MTSVSLTLEQSLQFNRNLGYYNASQSKIACKQVQHAKAIFCLYLSRYLFTIQYTYDII